MKKHIRSIGAALGIFTATVVITYAASSLIPTYAPGENPPDLDSAPLLYRMAGQTDPDSFNHANDSLKAIGEKLDEVSMAVDGMGSGGLESSFLREALIYVAVNNTDDDKINVDDMVDFLDAKNGADTVVVAGGATLPADKMNCIQLFDSDGTMYNQNAGYTTAQANRYVKNGGNWKITYNYLYLTGGGGVYTQRDVLVSDEVTTTCRANSKNALYSSWRNFADAYSDCYCY